MKKLLALLSLSVLMFAFVGCDTPETDDVVTDDTTTEDVVTDEVVPTTDDATVTPTTDDAATTETTDTTEPVTVEVAQ